MTKFITLGILNYAYGEAPDLTDPRGRGIFGWCDTTNQSIAGEANMSPGRKLVCKWHEILHAVANDYALRMNEQTIATLAMVITQLLRDNPELRGNEAEFTYVVNMVFPHPNGKEVIADGPDVGTVRNILQQEPDSDIESQVPAVVGGDDFQI